jgi:hypothetical protein
MPETHDNDRARNACLSDAGYITSDSSALSLHVPDPEKQSPNSSSSETIPAATNTVAADDDTIKPAHSPHPPPTNNNNNNNATSTEKDPPSTSTSNDDDLPTGAALTLHPSTATTIDFPEGGLTGWLVVLGSFSAMLSLFGLINSAAVFESYFSTHQLAHKTASEIGWIFSLYLFIVFFVGIQVGPVFDRFGARVLVAVGSALIFLSLLLLSWCEGTFSFLFCLPFFPFCFDW